MVIPSDYPLMLSSNSNDRKKVLNETFYLHCSYHLMSDAISPRSSVHWLQWIKILVGCHSGGPVPLSLYHCNTFKLVPQIDPSVPRLVVQSWRRPLLGPSPG